jgi:hypothetical protein
MPLRRQLVLATLVAFALLAPGPASAGTVDQQQTNTAGGGTAVNCMFSWAQTFTVGAGRSGNLDQVDLFLAGGMTLALTVQIQTVASGAPSGTALATESVSAASVPDDAGAWISIAIDPVVPVTAGTQYAIVATISGCPSDEEYGWFRSSSDVYAGGSAYYTAGSTWFASPFDLAFRTYVASSTAVTFRSLSASRSARGVVVRWSTASELNTLGFHVYRQVGDRRVRVNRRLIPAKGLGAYTLLDRRAPRAKTLRYWIQEVAVDGSRSWYGPVRART